MKDILVIGGGKIGSVVAALLAHAQGDTRYRVTVADRSAGAAASAAARPAASARGATAGARARRRRRKNTTANAEWRWKKFPSGDRKPRDFRSTTGIPSQDGVYFRSTSASSRLGPIGDS